jgi:Lhr-like helicase
MTNSEETEVARLRRLLKVALDHADSYKAHFHHLQDSMWAAERKAIQRGNLLKRQRAKIAELEARLGIDDEL